MSKSRTKGRRPESRAVRPLLDGRLEDRMLLSSAAARTQRDLAISHFLLTHPAPKNAYSLHKPPQLAKLAPQFHGRTRRRSGVVATQTARGGQNVEINAGGSHYMVSLAYTSNTLATNVAEGQNGQLGASNLTDASQSVLAANATFPQPIGTVRAYAMSNHRVGIIVDGSTQNTELTINPLGQQQRKGFAHSFAYGAANLGHILNVGQLTVSSGQIGDIEGFQTADLSGPLVVSGNTQIDRIALDAILPGGSITTGSDVNTLDVYNGITLTGTNINIGRDVNLLNVGGNISLSNGSQFNIARNLGLVSQPPKGTGTGTNILSLNFVTVSNSIVSVTIPAVGAYIQGSVIVNPGSLFNIGGNIFNTFYVEGSTTAGFTPSSNPGTPTATNPTVVPSLGTLSRLTVENGTPAPLLQSALSQFGSSTDTGYVTSLGGFA
ncbi:MAG TPA: hypothetical protein VHS97_04000 [Isosphaeraceae bacterium]|nr:hypothetical protein [Isosphaeraceae bacterium]